MIYLVEASWWRRRRLAVDEIGGVVGGGCIGGRAALSESNKAAGWQKGSCEALARSSPFLDEVLDDVLDDALDDALDNSDDASDIDVEIFTAEPSSSSLAYVSTDSTT